MIPQPEAAVSTTPLKLPSTLSAEQTARIERNRLAALQRRELREQQRQQEQQEEHDRVQQEQRKLALSDQFAWSDGPYKPHWQRKRRAADT